VCECHPPYICSVHPLSIELPSNRFLGLFQENKGKGRDSLHFVKSFTMSITHTDTNEIGTTENWLTAAQILTHNGVGWKDFASSEEALTAVRHLVDKNVAQAGSEGVKPEQLDATYPQFSRFFYVVTHGKKSSHLQSTIQTLEQTANLNKVGQLTAAKVFMEGMGFVDTEDSQVKIENLKGTEVAKASELAKLAYLCITKGH
jgi:hypothetical protein